MELNFQFCMPREVMLLELEVQSTKNKMFGKNSFDLCYEVQYCSAQVSTEKLIIVPFAYRSLYPVLGTETVKGLIHN